MVTARPLKKLSQATATAALGVAMLAALGTTKASAATFQTFQFSGNFADQANQNSTGLSAELAGGSFKGTYTIDVDKLPSTSQIALEDWNVDLFNASNTVVKTFSSSGASQFGVLKDGVLTFSEFLTTGTSPNVTTSYYTLAADFGDSFNGTGTGSGEFYNIVTTSNTLANAGRIVIQPTVTRPIPEPLALSGTVFASTVGLWLSKRQQQQAKAS